MTAMLPHWSTTTRPSVCGEAVTAFRIAFGSPRQEPLVICCQISAEFFLLRRLEGGSSRRKPWHAEICIRIKRLRDELTYGPNCFRLASSRRFKAWIMFTPPQAVGVYTVYSR